MIKDIYKHKPTVFSMEVFPPKTDEDFPSIFRTLDSMKTLNPDFISITYGAGGSTSKKTMDIASYVQNVCNIEALAHFTCAALDDHMLHQFLGELNTNHIHNVLALRGDKPQTMSEEDFKKRPYGYAKDLVKIMKQTSKLCIGGACYPEVHPESKNQKEDIYYLKSKVDEGMDFLITQLFFDNAKFYHFFEQAYRSGITIPISAGIMPLVSPNQIRTMIELSKASIPASLNTMIDKYNDNPDDFRKAGLEYARKQIADLIKNGVAGIHLYTLNKVDVSAALFCELGLN